MGDFCVYGHFAKQDFTDSEGNFHPKGSCCYIGSGNKTRPFDISKWSRRLPHAEVKDLLDVVILHPNLPADNKIIIEQECYDKYINDGCSLFNSHRPKAPKLYGLQLFSKYLCIDKDSPSYVSWRVDRFIGKGRGRLAFRAGENAGIMGNHGYFRLMLEGSSYSVHRIVYCLYHSVDLVGDDNVVDHINNIRSDNSPENLRVVSRRNNSRNLSVKVNSRSGLNGISLRYKEHCWRASARDMQGVAIEKSFPFTSELRKKRLTKGITYTSYEDAFLLATKWRNEKMREFGYTGEIIAGSPTISYEDYLQLR